ncbi:hypothetical protein F0562_032062 [Nyssa sinensis]|uniref:Uncharacterized protein n=1 Tax=Nyssa sinensis TaxID=561372 RepID=A0A5J5ATU3_9ASTE|nr:hypothetical protein F0562_032062 [Nyssa sinensis]
MRDGKRCKSRYSVLLKFSQYISRDESFHNCTAIKASFPSSQPKIVDRPIQPHNPIPSRSNHQNKTLTCDHRSVSFEI